MNYDDDIMLTDEYLRFRIPDSGFLIPDCHYVITIFSEGERSGWTEKGTFQRNSGPCFIRFLILNTPLT
jgi:hypothetical protein